MAGGTVTCSHFTCMHTHTEEVRSYMCGQARGGTAVRPLVGPIPIRGLTAAAVIPRRLDSQDYEALPSAEDEIMMNFWRN